MSCTSLTRAATGNDFEKFKELIDKGADVNQKDAFGWAPIHLAMYDQDQKIARFILGLPAFDINSQRSGGKESPLMYPITFHRKAVARELMSREGIGTQLKDADGLNIYD